MKKRGATATGGGAKGRRRKAEATQKVSAKLRWAVRTLKEVAEFFGAAPQTMSGWRRDGMPGTAGRFDLGEIARWLVGRRSRLVRRDDPEGLSLAARIQQEELRLKRARADAREFANRLAQSRYLETAEVERVIATMAAHTADLFQRIPIKMRPRLPAEQREELTADLAAEIARTLTVMADWRPESSAVEEEKE